jgi:hypothetical protein
MHNIHNNNNNNNNNNIHNNNDNKMFDHSHSSTKEQNSETKLLDEELYYIQKFRNILLSVLLISLFFPFIQYYGILPFLSIQFYATPFREPILYNSSFIYMICIGLIVQKIFFSPRYIKTVLLFE